MGYRKDWERLHGIKIPDGWQIHHWLPRSLGGDDRATNTVACPIKAHHKFHEHRGDKVSLKFISVAGSNPWNKGLTGSDTNRYGAKLSEETKRLVSINHADVSGSKNPMYGRFPKGTCEYCGKTCSVGMISRWHNENCKMAKMMEALL